MPLCDEQRFPRASKNGLRVSDEDGEFITLLTDSESSSLGSWEHPLQKGPIGSDDDATLETLDKMGRDPLGKSAPSQRHAKQQKQAPKPKVLPLAAVGIPNMSREIALGTEKVRPQNLPKSRGIEIDANATKTGAESSTALTHTNSKYPLSQPLASALNPYMDAAKEIAPKGNDNANKIGAKNFPSPPHFTELSLSQPFLSPYNTHAITARARELTNKNNNTDNTKETGAKTFMTLSSTHTIKESTKPAALSTNTHLHGTKACQNNGTNPSRSPVHSLVAEKLTTHLDIRQPMDTSTNVMLETDAMLAPPPAPIHALAALLVAEAERKVTDQLCPSPPLGPSNDPTTKASNKEGKGIYRTDNEMPSTSANARRNLMRYLHQASENAKGESSTIVNHDASGNPRDGRLDSGPLKDQCNGISPDLQLGITPRKRRCVQSDEDEELNPSHRGEIILENLQPFQTPAKRRYDPTTYHKDIPLLDNLQMETPIFKSQIAMEIREERRNSLRVSDPAPSSPDHEWQVVSSRRRAPQIHLHKIDDILPLLDMLNRQSGDNTYTTKSTPTGGLKIQAKSMDAYNNIKKSLQEMGIPTRSPQVERDRGFGLVIRHLNELTPTEWIKAELSREGYITRQVRAMINKNTGRNMKIFDLTIETKLDGSHRKILNLHKLGNQEVRIEEKVLRRDPMMCFNCQGFFHKSNACTKTPKCMKCAGNHPTRDCQKRRDSPATCVNCGGAHVANYKGCPAYKSACSRVNVIKPAPYEKKTHTSPSRGARPEQNNHSAHQHKRPYNIGTRRRHIGNSSPVLRSRNQAKEVNRRTGKYDWESNSRRLLTHEKQSKHNPFTPKPKNLAEQHLELYRQKLRQERDNSRNGNPFSAQKRQIPAKIQSKEGNHLHDKNEWQNINGLNFNPRRLLTYGKQEQINPFKTKNPAEKHLEAFRQKLHQERAYITNEDRRKAADQSSPDIVLRIDRLERKLDNFINSITKFFTAGKQNMDIVPMSA